MIVEAFTVGALYTNCYVASCKQTKEAVVIDPGLDFLQEAAPIFDYVDKGQLKVRSIINTHGHDDHIKADVAFQNKYAVPILIHPLDAPFLEGLQNGKPLKTEKLEDGSTVQFGTQTLKVMHTPGHSPGGICLVGEKLVFTGDTLFAGGIGRTDFAGGSMSDMRLSLQKLMRLPENLMVYPGHGESSLIGAEKRTNPFLSGRSEDLMF